MYVCVYICDKMLKDLFRLDYVCDRISSQRLCSNNDVHKKQRMHVIMYVLYLSLDSKLTCLAFDELNSFSALCQFSYSCCSVPLYGLSLLLLFN